MRVAVYEIGDRTPTRRVSRRTAERLTFTGWYAFKGRNAVERLAEKRLVTHKVSPIPDKLPPMELPGIKFELHKGEGWQRVKLPNFPALDQ